MYGQSGGMRHRVANLAARFREKGAISAEKAMTAQELGLPPRFEEAMHRRLGATKIFVEVGGKYYLDEARLQQFEQGKGLGAWGDRSSAGRNMLTLRIVRMVVGVSAIFLFLSNYFILQSTYVRLLSIGLVILWIALTVFQLLFLTRARSRWKVQPAAGQP